MGTDSTPAIHQVPLDRHYHPEHHTWAKLDETTGRVRVGVDALALESLGDVAHLVLEPVGTRVRAGDLLGTLEAAKMTSSLSSPLSGELVTRNEALLTDPRPINADPYGAGWLLELAAKSWAEEATDLLSGDASRNWAAEVAARLEAD